MKDQDEQEYYHYLGETWEKEKLKQQDQNSHCCGEITKQEEELWLEAN